MVQASSPTPVFIEIDGHHDGQGQFIVALFDSQEKFEAQQDPAYYLSIDNRDQKGKIQTLEFSSVAYGRYALAVFQDLNMNGKLDKNWMGIPKEPYGFSGEGNHKWRPPSFAEAAFTVSDGENRLRISLVEW
jgi:uncharacterized protein (DUF2141 family)